MAREPSQSVSLWRTASATAANCISAGVGGWRLAVANCISSYRHHRCTRCDSAAIMKLIIGCAHKHNLNSYKHSVIIIFGGIVMVVRACAGAIPVRGRHILRRVLIFYFRRVALFHWKRMSRGGVGIL